MTASDRTPREWLWLACLALTPVITVVALIAGNPNLLIGVALLVVLGLATLDY